MADCPRLLWLNHTITFHSRDRPVRGERGNKDLPQDYIHLLGSSTQTFVKLSHSHLIKPCYCTQCFRTRFLLYINAWISCILYMWAEKQASHYITSVRWSVWTSRQFISSWKLISKGQLTFYINHIISNCMIVFFPLLNSSQSVSSQNCGLGVSKVFPHSLFSKTENKTKTKPSTQLLIMCWLHA